MENLNNKLQRDKFKAYKVIHSCKTVHQSEVAKNYLTLLSGKWKGLEKHQISILNEFTDSLKRLINYKFFKSEDKWN